MKATPEALALAERIRVAEATIAECEHRSELAHLEQRYMAQVCELRAEIVRLHEIICNDARQRLQEAIFAAPPRRRRKRAEPR